MQSEQAAPSIDAEFNGLQELKTACQEGLTSIYDIASRRFVLLYFVLRIKLVGA
jgi:hypothetical protein